MSPRPFSLPVISTLARHPDDGFQLADPVRMNALSRRALRGLVDALLPPAPAPRSEGLEDRIAIHVRRMMMYMPIGLRLGFLSLIHLLHWSPVWRLRGLRPLSSLPPERASEILAELGNSRFMLLRLMLLGPKACVLSTYFDQDEVHEALDYAPRAFMAERIARRRALLTADLQHSTFEHASRHDRASMGADL